ncbi:hypothetical protein ABH992_006757 [Bradyrhizobium yuanmingense]|uniref:Uncharacterized protein n=1 Tax=Bradyrhizobium yuanmingense TaxID=108015 RepID=A0ABV4GQY5_9BRAD
MPSAPVRKPEIRRPGPERLARKLRLAKSLQPVAGRVSERDQLGDMPLVSECARTSDHPDAMAFEPSCQLIQFDGRRNFPSHHRKASIAAAVDDQPLLAVVHAEGPHLAAAIDLLHAEQPGRHPAPLLEL